MDINTTVLFLDIFRLMNHCVNYAQHDPIITKQEMTNPWIAIDEYFYEDLIDL